MAQGRSARNEQDATQTREHTKKWHALALLQGQTSSRELGHPTQGQGVEQELPRPEGSPGKPRQKPTGAHCPCLLRNPSPSWLRPGWGIKGTGRAGRGRK